MMKKRNIENRLALVGALIVLIGVSSAATSAFAAAPTDVLKTSVARHSAADATVIRAKKEITDAAVEAAESLKAGITFDLEIHMKDLTSSLIAGAK